MAEISVIIPMYNSEAFIGQCIRSVAGQTFGDLEILVIDDGSVDKGAEICRKLGDSDGRIRVLRQENGGVSSARNHGIEAASGKYVFFLDSDDAIHPRLLEEMFQQAEKCGAGLAFCSYKRLGSSQLETVLEEAVIRREYENGAVAAENGNSSLGEQAYWLTADERDTAEWFHVKYTDVLSGIGGKLILREAIGELRFDKGLTNGEDTFFLYQLVKRGVKSLYCTHGWYYYRTHGESVTNSRGLAKGSRYFESAKRIRDGEYESGHADHAMRWEILVIDQLRKNYAARREGQRKADRREQQRIAGEEMRHPLFRRICFSDRLLFSCCFACYPLYVMLNGIVSILAKWRSR